MSAIRRANPESRIWKEELSHISSDAIRNPVTDPSRAEGLFPEYPYEGQEILKVEFDYLLDSPGDHEPTSLDMAFYYRTESALWILDPGVRDTLTSEVVQELRSELVDKLSILPGISVSKKGIWSFIQSSREVRDVIVRHNFQSISWGDIDILSSEEIVSEKKVLRAELVFEYRGRTIDVIFSDDNLSVSTRSDDDFEYIIQKFETSAIHPR